MQDRLKDLFSDLGRRNFRGVRPCPKCGTYNGIRGFSCKNKSCDVVFKAMNDRRKKNTVDVCRIQSRNSSNQIYSVRLRDKGPDYRAFVQVSTELIDGGDGNIMANQSAHCFVEACSKIYATNEDFTANCSHIKAVSNCQSDSEVLSVKASFVDSLNIKADIKDELLGLLSSSTENGMEIPVVQRVTKTIFVVRTDKLEKFPLGFLHCAFVDVKNKSDGIERKFYCPCRKFKGSVENARDCVHYYACLVAFLSEENLTTEFAQQIHVSGILAVSLGEMEVSEMLCGDVSFTLPEDGSVITGTSNLALDNELNTDFLNPPMDHSDTSPSIGVAMTESEAEKESADMITKDSSEDVNLTLPIELNVANLNSFLVSCGDQVLRISSAGKVQIPALKKDNLKSLIVKPSAKKAVAGNEDSVSLGFQTWLSSVTERINQTVDLRVAENPDALVFNIPQAFFECLRERISSGNRKKRLPNETVVVERKDQPPFRAVTKYTWRLHNPLFVKHIFDTPLVSLQLSRSFVESQNGTLIPALPEKETASLQKSGYSLPVLRPRESRAYLKIALASPFMIEWIPDVLPVSKVGELVVRFQLQHQRHSHKRPHASLQQTNDKEKTYELGLISTL